MRCRFCYATFQDVKKTVLPKGHLRAEDALRVTELLCQAGASKLTFAGGEPTLCPWLDQLLLRTRQSGTTTMLVTNGSQLRDQAYRERLLPLLDWVALSIDSTRPETHQTLGRSLRGHAIPPSDYMSMASAVRHGGVRLKVNTVVTAANWDEDMSDLLLSLQPERWKVLRVLPIAGQNDGKVEPLLISDEQFLRFCDRHRGLQAHGITPVFEDHEDIIGGYAMVDPAGRFFDNTAGRYRYSTSILETGVSAAWAHMRFSPERFAGRGGIYEWSGRRQLPVL